MPDVFINTQSLLNYIEGRLDTEEHSRIEQAVAADPFLRDALEGLHSLQDKQQLDQVVRQLNARLRLQVNKRRQHRRKPMVQPLWMYVLLLLLLVVIAWVAVSMLS